ncbi:MAG: GFA family protein [Rhizorhabdus sp.]
MSAPVTAHCQCGQLSVECHGHPARVSICHCHDCQRRSGAAFSAQIRFHTDNVRVSGEYHSWTRISDSGNKAVFHFCPTCGSTLFYDIEMLPGLRAIPMGTFAGTALPAPWFSVYENRKLPWVEIVGEGIEHD